MTHSTNDLLLDKINSPADVRQLPKEQLKTLCKEVREFLTQSVSVSGGHFAAGLGTVELTVALHYVFDTPNDKLVWDVGHQAYPHKILTGRKDRMTSIRAKDGVSAFPNRSESEYDAFGVGHSSTSISAALGMAIASRLKGENKQMVAPSKGIRWWSSCRPWPAKPIVWSALPISSRSNRIPGRWMSSWPAASR